MRELGAQNNLRMPLNENGNFSAVRKVAAAIAHLKRELRKESEKTGKAARELDGGKEKPKRLVSKTVLLSPSVPVLAEDVKWN